MDERRVHRVVKLADYPWIGPYYYKYPDGQDLYGKLYFTTQTAGTAAGLYGVVRCVMPPQPASISEKFLRLGKCIVPAVGMAAAFTCTTYYSTVLRKTDDIFNHGVGGISAGILGGMFMGGNKPVTCVALAVMFSLFAMGLKSSLMEEKPKNARLIPTRSSYTLRHLDTSLLPEIEGNWTREPPAK